MTDHETNENYQTQIEFINNDRNFFQWIGIDLHRIPDYLCLTNECFQILFQTHLSLSNEIDLLKDITILMYKMKSIKIIESLWKIYEQSGRGQLQLASNNITIKRPIWPSQVWTLLKQWHRLTNNDNYTCSNLIKYVLDELNQRYESYEKEFQMKIKNSTDYNARLSYTLEKFIEKHNSSLAMKTNQEVLLVQYHYIDQSLQHDYLALNPNHDQVNRFCFTKYTFHCILKTKKQK